MSKTTKSEQQKALENRKILEDPLKYLHDTHTKNRANVAKIATGSKAYTRDEQEKAHRTLRKSAALVEALGSNQTDTPFVMDPIKNRIVVIPFDHTLSVTQFQSHASPDAVGDGEVGLFFTSQFDAAEAERKRGLHKNSFKTTMCPLEAAITGLSTEDHDFLRPRLNPKHAYNAEEDDTPQEKLEGASRQSAVVHEGPDDFWTASQKLARLLPGFIAGAAGTSFRGRDAREKTFMLLFMTLTGLSEVPEVGSPLSKRTAKEFFEHFFVHTNQQVEPLAATDGFPVKKDGRMVAAMDAADPEVYERQVGETPHDIKYELVYTCSFADADMMPYPPWCPEATDFRDVQRVGVRLLEFTFDLAKRLLGPEEAHVPFLIREWKRTNSKCKQIFNTAELAETVCSNPARWNLLTRASAQQSFEDHNDMVRSWADAPYTNPSIKFCSLDGESSKALFYSKPREKEMVDETLLRLTAYDADDKKSTSLGAKRTECLPILDKVVCAAAGLETGGTSTVVVHDDGAPVGAGVAGAASTGRGRKRSQPEARDVWYASIMEKLSALCEAQAILSKTVDSINSRLVAEQAKGQTFRRHVRPALASIIETVTANESFDTIDGGEERGEEMDASN